MKSSTLKNGLLGLISLLLLVNVIGNLSEGGFSLPESSSVENENSGTSESTDIVESVEESESVQEDDYIEFMEKHTKLISDILGEITYYADRSDFEMIKEYGILLRDSASIYLNLATNEIPTKYQEVDRHYRRAMDNLERSGALLYAGSRDLNAGKIDEATEYLMNGTTLINRTTEEMRKHN